MELKYGIWNVKQPNVSSVNALVSGGYSPLAAMVLAGRGMENAQQADKFLDCNCPMPDAYLLTDMALAAGRVAAAIARGEKIAVFGDYDVDGITATCLLTDFLRKQGADCISYIPGRLEEGYGLNSIALSQLQKEGVALIITVDCGITAIEEAEECSRLGMDLVITDHHECKDRLPQAIAVVDPHRPDGGYPHKNLSGVAVAFKLACALSGNPEEVLKEYADMVCLGTVADVIPLVGENRVFVSRGLKALSTTTRPGLAALIAECGCDEKNISATTIGFMLAPRINAAGRMGQVDLAVDLFLTQDADHAKEVAAKLCELNRQRQQIESDIYSTAIAMLPEGAPPEAIVLADEGWHQGVVGIVASRIAEEFACPAFLICLDGSHGKASSRSHGGFNLFASLTELSPLLESYGGHELAAGFTISKENIPEFRRRICAMAADYYENGTHRTVLELDCAISPEMLTIPEIESLQVLEPCGSGCPKPTLMMQGLTIDRVQPVGGGRHTRLRLRKGRVSLNAIFFSASPESASIAPGDIVDVAFNPQINEYRGERSVQMNIVDIRPACAAPCSMDVLHYQAMRKGQMDREIALALLPSRATLACVWRYLASVPGGTLQESPLCLCRKIVRRSGEALSLEQLLTCLDIFRDVGLLEQKRVHLSLFIRLNHVAGKADLNQSTTMQTLLRGKES